MGERKEPNDAGAGPAEVKLEGKFDDGSVQYTITLEDLCLKLQEAADAVGTKRANRLLFLNTVAALRTLGERLEDVSRELAELKNTPRIIAPGGRIN